MSPGPTREPAPAEDPVLARRNRFRTAAHWGKRLGYSLFGLASLALIAAFVLGFSDGWGRIIIGCLLAGSALLLPAIIIGYAVKAADRADLGLPDGH